MYGELKHKSLNLFMSSHFEQHTHVHTIIQTLLHPTTLKFQVIIWYCVHNWTHQINLKKAILRQRLPTYHTSAPNTNSSNE